MEIFVDLFKYKLCVCFFQWEFEECIKITSPKLDLPYLQSFRYELIILCFIFPKSGFPKNEMTLLMHPLAIFCSLSLPPSILLHFWHKWNGVSGLRTPAKPINILPKLFVA